MKPYTICHMIASVDGRIDCDMTEQIEGGNEYYEALESLACPSMLMGRVTMQMHYALAEPFITANTTPIGCEAFHIARKAAAYCVGVDTHGILQWGESEFDGQALLVITDEQCPKAYHDRLTEQGISWIATGKNGINLARAMELLAEKFGVERLAITGGGHINGAFLEAELLDEVSFMVDDVKLFLDTHPCDENAMACFKEYSDKRNELLKEYSKLYMPLTVDLADMSCTERWNWIHEPWPWQEGGC